jgi:exopolyphosphatase/guanosine-5'-triphosphate,3'-diphosphate pyrophosphatase
VERGVEQEAPFGASHGGVHPGLERPVQATPARRDHVYGALDLGTNNCRLLVARPTGDTFRVIDAFSRIVRLGEAWPRRDD